jgi:hypothetical protein
MRSLSFKHQLELTALGVTLDTFDSIFAPIVIMKGYSGFSEPKMMNSVRRLIASGFLLSLFWAGDCVARTRQTESAGAGQNLKFQPKLVTKTVSVIKPQASGSVTTALKGTELAPNASGQVKLKMGDVEVTVEAQANGLNAPGSFGTEFETYIVWAITPAGKVFKLGPMADKGNRFELKTKTAVRSFAIVVTAEPYQQVARPSDMIVLEVPAGGQITVASCALLKGGYTPVGYTFPPIDTGAAYPSQIVQMYNARRIARLAGAEGNKSFKSGDELFNYVVSSAQRQKKITDVMLSQAVTATKYFEEARETALQYLMQ